MAEIPHVTNTRLIGCVLPKGRARALQLALTEQQDIHCGIFHHGRGVGRDSIRDRGIGEQQERELFEVVVPADQADALFEFIFFEASMDEPHGGMLYMTSLLRSTVMRMPEIPPEE